MGTDASEFRDRAILSTTNSTIDHINDTIRDRLPDNVEDRLSADSLISDEIDPDHEAFVSIDQLNTYHCTGCPPHKLSLKNNMLVMITRNVNFSDGLVNGQKAVVRGLTSRTRVVTLQLLNDSNDLVLVPRINFTPKVGRNGIEFRRLQFPIRPAYAQTIHKAQSQTLSRVGLDLRSDVFSHGQLYVALSRAQSKNSLMALIAPNRRHHDRAYTSNVISPEFIVAATGSPPPTCVPKALPGVSFASPPTRTHTMPPLFRNPSPTQSPPLSPPHSPIQPNWTIQPEIGDGACFLRTVARKIYNNPNLHSVVRQLIIAHFVQDPALYSDYLQPNGELLRTAGQLDRTYSSFDEYVAIMSHPYTYTTEKEIAAARRVFGLTINITVRVNHHDPLPPPGLDPAHLHILYYPTGEHFATLLPI